MSDWNPSLYLHFAAERSRPAVELLARVSLENIEYIADLGCGPGNSTALLHQRWPAARDTVSWRVRSQYTLKIFRLEILSQHFRLWLFA